MGTLDLLKLLLRLLYYYCGTTQCRFLLRGGGKRDRTADLLHAMQALSQLSYTPVPRRSKIIADSFEYAKGKSKKIIQIV